MPEPTTWVEECMAKQASPIPTCARCHKSTGKGHCYECRGCRPTPKADMVHKAWCSRYAWPPRPGE